MKRILICGATGFIGKNLLDFYCKSGKYKIRATHFKRPALLQYEGVEWVQCDLRDPNQVSNVLKGVDIVMQFAATTTGAKDIVSKPYIHVTDNAIMNSYLLRESFEQGIEHFIFPSCTIMYQRSQKALKEDDYNPSDEILPFYYGAGHTKVYLENMCKFYAGFGKTKHTVIRHSNLYGPHDKYDLEKSHMFGATITKVMQAKDGDEIVVWGNGSTERDLLYVDDVVEFITLAIEKQSDRYKLYNVGYGQSFSVKNIVQKIVDHSGKDVIITYDLTKPNINTKLALNSEKALEELGWSPNTDIDAGIIKTIEWYRENIMESP